jgi:hypothetical protein
MAQQFLSGTGLFSKQAFSRFTLVGFTPLGHKARLGVGVLRTLGLLGVTLSLAAPGCGDDKKCDTGEHTLGGDTQGQGGVSPNELLKQSKALVTGVEWEENPSFLQRNFKGRTRLTFSLEGTGDGFDSRTESDCTPYVGVPVHVRLSSVDGVVSDAAGDGTLTSGLNGFRELEVAFKAEDIKGTIAPTNGADLIVRMSWLGEIFEGTISARVVHQGDARFSVNQVEIGTIDSGRPGDEHANADAGAPSATPSTEPEPVIPIGSVPPVSVATATASDAQQLTGLPPVQPPPDAGVPEVEAGDAGK